MGGRVHTARDGPLGAPVDLGASIITGTATDAGKGLRADPSAVIARFGAPGCSCLDERGLCHDSRSCMARSHAMHITGRCHVPCGNCDDRCMLARKESLHERHDAQPHGGADRKVCLIMR